jgi:outer membrane receptor for Fe3+-dicitrate
MLALSLPAPAAGDDEIEEITVIGVTPTEGAELDPLKIPANVQTVTGEDLQRTHSLDLSDYMSRALGSVSINSAQNNPLQPDVQFRGFTASPLLGLPQGLAIYQDGARINEPFGDSVNWDLLPQSAVAGITLTGGANPIFGLNTLGGALVIDMKTGFSYQGTEADVSTGSWGRVTADVQSGGNNGSFGYYVDASWFEEDGWRDLSNSDAKNLYGSLSWEGEHSSLEMGGQYGRSTLRGNGPTPVGLAAVDREAFFTAPDITGNDLRMITLEGTHAFSGVVSFSSSAFWRSNETDSFNGDASDLLVCELGNGERLLDGLEGDDLEALDVEEDDLCNGSFANVDALNAFLNGLAGGQEFDVEDLTGDVSGTGILSDEAINNRSTRDQRSRGADLQLSLTGDLAGMDNLFVVGLAWFDGRTGFDSTVELSLLDPVTRSTAGLGTGAFLDNQATRVDTETRSKSFYFTDTLSATKRWAVNVGGRYNETRVELDDRSGERPELNGNHEFHRFNPTVGLTFQAAQSANLYWSYAESSRAPTPIELSCNEGVFELAQRIAIENGEDPGDVDFECRLPNAFLSDPPLAQVVAKSYEVGVRGKIGAATDYHVGAFRTTNQNDILFQTTGRSTGLFANVDETRREGIEMRLHGRRSALDWYAAYTRLDATFEDDFDVLSPNHPFADENGEIAVTAGDRIPGIPRDQLKAGGDWRFGSGWSLGAEGIYNSGQFLRGDESNQLDELDGYFLVNLRGAWSWQHVEVYARIDNVLDEDYVNFGLLGEDPSEVLPGLADERPIFVGVGAPRAGWIGFRVSM